MNKILTILDKKKHFLLMLVRHGLQQLDHPGHPERLRLLQH
jgi:hypothetical protein